MEKRLTAKAPKAKKEGENRISFILLRLLRLCGFLPELGNIETLEVKVRGGVVEPKVRRTRGSSNQSSSWLRILK
jgi:hypothetical protein